MDLILMVHQQGNKARRNFPNICLDQTGYKAFQHNVVGSLTYLPITSMILKIDNECLQEEVEHLGKFFVNEVSCMSNRELEGSHLPPLGSRVRRGPDWKYNNQDQGGPGTIVGHDRGTVSEAQLKFNL